MLKPVKQDNTPKKTGLGLLCLAIFASLLKTICEHTPIVGFFAKWASNCEILLNEQKHSNRERALADTFNRAIAEPFTNPDLIAKKVIEDIQRDCPGDWQPLPKPWQKLPLLRTNGKSEKWAFIAGDERQSLYIAVPLDEKGRWLPVPVGNGAKLISKVVSKEEFGECDLPKFAPPVDKMSLRRGKTVLSPCSDTVLDVLQPKIRDIS